MFEALDVKPLKGHYIRIPRPEGVPSAVIEIVQARQVEKVHASAIVYPPITLTAVK
jgi:hypothetical protein